MSSMPRKKKQPTKIKTKESHKGTLWTVAGLSLLVIIGAAYIFFGNTSGGAVVSIEVNEEVRVGEPFDVSLLFENRSGEEVSEATLSLSLPDGVSFTDGRGDIRRSIDVKSIPDGSFERKTFSVTVTQFSDAKNFGAEAEYTPTSLNKPIKVFGELSIDVHKWLSIDIETPEKIVSGEEFEWVFSYKNDSDKDWLVDLTFEIPDELDTDLPDLVLDAPAGEEGKEVLTGSIVFEEGRSFYIKAIAKGEIENEEYILDEAYAETVIAPSPLSLSLATSGGGNEPVSPGQEITYSISFKNNADIPLRNISVRASFVGEMFDMTSVSSRGETDISSNTVLWNVTNIPELQEIAPGESRSLGLSVRIRDSYPIRRLNDRNFMLGMNVRIESPTVPYSLKTLRTVNIVSMTQKVSGKIEADAKALYRDAASGILNEGNFPPMVGQATEYTVHWDVTNYSTDMSDVEVSAELPPGVELSDDIKVDAGEFKSSDDGRRVVWKIPKMLATTGILSDPIGAIFQIRATPVSGYVGSYMPILGPTNISARDDFTGKEVSSFKDFLSTELDGDPTVRPEDGIVR